MNRIKLLVVLFFASFMLYPADLHAAKASKTKVPAGTRVVKLSDVGKPGSGLRMVKNESLVAQILRSGNSPRSRVATNGNSVSVDHQGHENSAAIVEDVLFPSMDLAVHLNEGAVVVMILHYPSGRTLVAGKFQAEEEGDYLFILIDGELSPIFTLEERPSELHVRGFDETTGDFFSVYSDLEYGVPPCGGIGEVKTEDGSLEIQGYFGHSPEVWINWEQVPDDQIRVKEDGLEVDTYSSETGEPLLFPGYNAVTVVNSDGMADTVSYRYNPGECVPTWPAQK